MLQYKIPQNIGIEDKIVGPFSLRQLIILAVGGGISYTLFAISSRLYELNVIEYILIALPALFSLAAAMLKIHNVTFTKYILLMLEFAIKPRKRIWDHRGISALVAPDLREKTGAKEKGKTPEKSRKNVNLSQLSAMLDSGGFEHVQSIKHEDIDKVDDDDLITEAYFGHKKKESSTENMYWRTREVQKKKLDLLAKIKPTATTSVTTPTPAPAMTPFPAPAVAAPAPAAAPVNIPATVKVVPPLPATKEARKETVVEQIAKVIDRTRKNNQAATENDTPKKKRKRHKKPKGPTPPVRKETPVNTISEAQPPKPVKQPPKPAEKETSFNDLSQGGEIEFNLD